MGWTFGIVAYVKFRSQMFRNSSEKSSICVANSFTNRVKHFAAEMDDFSLEFLNISERNFT